MDCPIDWQEYGAAPAGGVWTHYAEVSNGHAFRKANGDVVVFSNDELEDGCPPDDEGEGQSEDSGWEMLCGNPAEREARPDFMVWLSDEIEAKQAAEEKGDEQAEAYAEMTAGLLAAVYGKGSSWENGMASRLETVCDDPAEAKALFSKIIDKVA